MHYADGNDSNFDNDDFDFRCTQSASQGVGEAKKDTRLRGGFSNSDPKNRWANFFFSSPMTDVTQVFGSQVKRGSIPWIDQSPVGETPNLPGDPARWNILTISILRVRWKLTRIPVSGAVRRRAGGCQAAQASALAPLKRPPMENLKLSSAQRQLRAKLRPV